MPEGGCLTGCGRSGGTCCPEGRSAADSKPPGDCICLMWAAAYRANGDSTDCFRAILADAALQGGEREGIQPLLPQVRPALSMHSCIQRAALSQVPFSCCTSAQQALTRQCRQHCTVRGYSSCQPLKEPTPPSWGSFRPKRSAAPVLPFTEQNNEEQLTATDLTVDSGLGMAGCCAGVKGSESDLRASLCAAASGGGKAAGSSASISNGRDAAAAKADCNEEAAVHRLADGAGPAQAQQLLAKTEARASDHANTDCRQLCLNMQRLQQAQLSESKQHVHKVG